jgi:hypothetical protein
VGTPGFLKPGSKNVLLGGAGAGRIAGGFLLDAVGTSFATISDACLNPGVKKELFGGTAANGRCPAFFGGICKQQQDVESCDPGPSVFF